MGKPSCVHSKISLVAALLPSKENTQVDNVAEDLTTHMKFFKERRATFTVDLERTPCIGFLVTVWIGDMIEKNILWHRAQSAH